MLCSEDYVFNNNNNNNEYKDKKMWNMHFK